MAVTINGDGVVDVGGNASSAAYVRLYEDSDNGTNYVDLIAPASVASNRTITLPDNTGTMLTSASSITASQLPAGSVLQVVSATKTDTFTTTSSTFTDVTGLSVSITPTSATSKILILTNVNISGLSRYNGMRLVRDSTAIGIGDSSGSRTQLTAVSGSDDDNTQDEYVMHNSSASFLDSPNTTSATTYKIQVRYFWTGTVTTYINRAPDDADAAYSPRGISTITVMEIAA